jgi:DNA-binding MarR family transcriptional regulator
METQTIVDQKKLSVWKTFLRAHATLLRTLENELQAQQGLSLTWYEVLLHLNKDPRGGLRMQELAEAVILSRSGLTRLLDRMENAGLVQRRPCAHDRRGAYALITPEGKTLFELIRPVVLQSIETHFAQHLDEAACDTLLGVFNKILEAEA